MYNRYIPQGDGTYRKRAIKESMPGPPPPQHRPLPPEPGCPSCGEEAQSEASRPCRAGSPARERRHEPDAGGFLKDLIPRDLHTEDLLIIILLLLMAGENRKGQNLPLLTLALYLFL